MWHAELLDTYRVMLTSLNLFTQYILHECLKLLWSACATCSPTLIWWVLGSITYKLSWMIQHECFEVIMDGMANNSTTFK